MYVCDGEILFEEWVVMLGGEWYGVCVVHSKVHIIN